MNVDVKSLSALIADRLRLVAVELVPLDVECAWPVYRAAAIGCAPMLVKVTERAAAERTLSFLSSAKGCPINYPGYIAQLSQLIKSLDIIHCFI